MAVDESRIRLYRVMDFKRVVQIFEQKALFFAHPSVWDDPYEQRIVHHQNDALFSQCWCRKGVSDAMWRIYSPGGLGVRVSTTVGKLKEVLRRATKEEGFRYRLAEVKYDSQVNINSEARRIKASLEDKFDIKRATDMLYLKREAFSHEEEWRATLYFNDIKKVQGKKGVTVKIDPHIIINNILLDPRAPKELTDAFEFYFRERFKFLGSIKKSVLYNVPSRLEVKGLIAEDL